MERLFLILLMKDHIMSAFFRRALKNWRRFPEIIMHGAQENLIPYEEHSMFKMHHNILMTTCVRRGLK